MRMTIPSRARHVRLRLVAEEGFTLLFALGALTVCTLLVGAVLWAVQADAGLTATDLSGKQAYAAAQSGAQAYLFRLNDNSASSSWWQDCNNDSGQGIVSTDSGESYSFAPVIGGCDQAGAIGTVLDPLTGQLRIKFTGTSGSASRTIVVAFRAVSPLSYLWYSVHETWDPNQVDDDQTCLRLYRDNPGPDAQCNNSWGFRWTINGPMYTQDQFNVDGSAQGGPTFGSGPDDAIASVAPSVCKQSQCHGANIKGTLQPNAPPVPLPSDNQQLESDAQNPTEGNVLYGATTLTIDGSTARATSCTSASSTSCTKKTIDLGAQPLIYVANGPESDPNCPTTAYTPSDVPNPPTIASGAYAGNIYGGCGDVYLENSNYSTGVTIASQDDIVVEQNLVADSNDNGMPTGDAMAGLVADSYVRLADPLLATGGCLDPQHDIDAAVLALSNAVYADNTNCLNPHPSPNDGQFTFWGSLAQQFRGHFGVDAYTKVINYDKRLAYEFPPYMFDLQDASWQVVRETLCAAGQPKADSQSCAYQN